MVIIAVQMAVGIFHSHVLSVSGIIRPLLQDWLAKFRSAGFCRSYQLLIDYTCTSETRGNVIKSQTSDFKFQTSRSVEWLKLHNITNDRTYLVDIIAGINLLNHHG